MKTSLASIVSLAFLLGCSSSEEGPGQSSLTTAAKFCTAWAQKACNDQVVDACSADNAEECVKAQQEFCLDLLPVGYQQTYAEECLSAVESAYADADLSAEELGVVLKLAAPCDRLIDGGGEAGDTCTVDTNCNTLANLKCVLKAGDASGTCQEPTQVGGGQKCTAADQVCAEGFYCNGTNCLAYKELDEECANDAECAPEFRCSTSGACVARAEDGDACQTDQDCGSLLCAKASGDEGICVSEVRLSAPIPLCEALRE